jgi:hypothetical protein
MATSRLAAGCTEDAGATALKSDGLEFDAIWASANSGDRRASRPGGFGDCHAGG